MENIRIAVDAMGGDNAPEAPVKGAIEALNKAGNIRLIFLGDEKMIKDQLSGLKYPKEAVQIVNCTETIGMAEPPVAAISQKKDSSIVKGMQLVRQGEAEAFVSAGSSGAILVGGQVIVGRIRGVERPPFAAVMPTEKGSTLLLDCGANVDARPAWLLQFAQMGSIYMERAMHIERPTVGILSIGAEEEKGNALVKETIPLLKEDQEINYIGPVEARDVAAGAADVIVTDAFSGNLIMKMYEGTATAILHVFKKALLSTVKSKIGALLIKDSLKSALKTYDASQYGGAPMLGLKGLVVKAHGSSKAKEFSIAVMQCHTFYEEDVNGKIRERMESQAAKMREMKKKKKEEERRGK